MNHSRILTVTTVLALAAMPVSAQYEPPAGYYSSATGVGSQLQNALHNIIDSHIVRSYDAARQALQLLDEDANNANNVIQIYTGQSVLGVWDSGATWNREHQWPRSRGIDTTGADSSDLHNLRPADPGVNNSRGNLPFGLGGGFWDPAALAMPGVNDRGDCSRAMFYMAVRYDGSDSSTTDLVLVNGQPGGNQMGDLGDMLEWHYTDPVDTIERRRNHLIWSSVDNPFYFQNNRNPFIDHPEFVWAIWGPTPNDTTLYFGGSAPPDGASSLAFGVDAIVDGAPVPLFVQLNKDGSTPTTYDINVVGDEAVFSDLTGQAFGSGGGSKLISIDWPSTAFVAEYSATLNVDNSDLTSAGTAQGSADGDDTVDVTMRVLDHAEASFDPEVDQNSLTVPFGLAPPNSAQQVLPILIHNLDAPLSAGLRVVSVFASGDTAELDTDIMPGGVIAPGGSAVFSAILNPPAQEGTYTATYTIQVADELLPGSASGTPLVLTLTATIDADGCSAFSQCADTDANGVRDDACVWWACDGGVCSGTDIVFADMGGPNGGCSPDGTADANDLFHALNCFSNSTTLGVPGYTCESDPPTAFNVDAGGATGACPPDGVCDGNDAFHALNAFDGSTTCSCAGPAPSGPLHDLDRAAGVPLEAARLELLASSRRTAVGEVIEVDVYLVDGLADLRGYQLHLRTGGGRTGQLELLDIAVHNRLDAAFSGLAAWSAFNVDTAQMVVGLDAAGVAVAPGSYFATYTYAVSPDAAGRFSIELLTNRLLSDHRTFLFPTPASGRIDLEPAEAVGVEVTSGSRRARRKPR